MRYRVLSMTLLASLAVLTGCGTNAPTSDPGATLPGQTGAAPTTTKVAGMGTVLLDEVIETSYGQVVLDWSKGAGNAGDSHAAFVGQVNGLVGAADPGGVFLNLAGQDGGHVLLVLHDAEPSLPPARFKDVVEVSVTVPAGIWVAWASESSGDIRGWAPGSYRMRVSALDRDAAHVGLPEGVDDEYLLEVWPASPAPDDVVRVGTEDAAYWHREVAGRR